jgi:hypothetical protein
MSRRSVIVGTGSALPPRRVTNAELAERVETTHEWIVERTGIEARHIAADGETTATLATEAAEKALAAAGVPAADLPAYEFQEPVAGWLAGYRAQMGGWDWQPPPPDEVAAEPVLYDFELRVRDAG